MMAYPDGVEGDVATLRSPPYIVSENTTLCVAFSFMMAGTGSGELRLSIAVEGQPTMPWWTVSGEHALQVQTVLSTHACTTTKITQVFKYLK